MDTRDLEAQLLADDEDETTLVIGSWHYQGTGWTNPGDEALAVAAAARAREYAVWKAENRWKATRTDGKERVMADQDHDQGGVVIPRLLTVKDVAAILEVPPSTVAHWAVEGSGPPSFKIGKHRRFDAEAVRDWLDVVKRMSLR